ncbi:tripartite tricarboxylate transporter substrate binding protein [Verticiella sediminum]|uniref:Tripartite tricarboxylate transporter substrate binding protein n=1 Tax=Verticiella sediminum TaxID=1247510 RepID=A0A556ATP1_9BURK|nr:tripartite tricarboxylate transporter substrate binding protein [Verticiella sediminum]TSH96308.1 tripartite tricarboxylate transporter substrate binding protein [Verticiella sediminum]
MKTTMVRKLAAALCCSLLGTSALAAAEWPAKPVRLLVGFTPGGPTDNVARILADKLGSELGQPVIVENRAGAAGNIAATALKQAAADGYTLLYNTSSIVIAPWVYRSPGFEPLKDFAPVGLTAAVPLVLAVTTKIEADAPDDLAALIKAKPGEYNYASSGVGAIEHLTAAQLLSALGLQATHVAYKGTAPAQVDLIAGSTQFTTTTLNTAIGPVQAGQLKALAITSRERWSGMPELPTIAETLVPGFESLAWQGIVAPAGTPEPVLQRLNQAINAALASPEVRQKLDQQGTITLGGSVEDYRGYMAAEYERWGKVVEATGARID